MIDLPQQQRLVDLWNARLRASEADWTELYRLVERALAGCGARVLAGLNADRPGLVHDFFYQKVFLTADRTREPLQHAAAICGFFRNYLNDRWRAQAASDGRHVELDEARAEDGAAAETENGARAVHDDEAGYETLLGEAGIPLARMTGSVERFIDELAGEDKTYVLYLKLHLCPDEPVPLSTLAQTYRIPSYHYRAERLGITGKKGGFARGYEKTRIGQWLVSLGLRIESAFEREIAAAFAYLCAGALARLQVDPAVAR